MGIHCYLGSMNHPRRVEEKENNHHAHHDTRARSNFQEEGILHSLKWCVVSFQRFEIPKNKIHAGESITKQDYMTSFHKYKKKRAENSATSLRNQIRKTPCQIAPDGRF